LGRTFNCFFSNFLDFLVSQFELFGGPGELIGLFLDRGFQGSDPGGQDVLFALEILA